jgi:D-inositol-3-phosphate glycosyltransferase
VNPTILLLCTSRALGGIELNVLRLAGWMRERGHDVAVAGLSATPLLRRARDSGLETIDLGTSSGALPLTAAQRLHAAWRRQRGTVCIINLSRDIHLAMLARAMGGVRPRLWYMQHMQIGMPKRDALHAWEYARLEHWIAPLPWLAAQAREMTRVRPSALRIIPLGIDLRPFASMPQRTDARRVLGLPADGIVACTVGRYDEGKGQEHLLSAAATLHRDGRTMHVLLVGEDTRGEHQMCGERLAGLAESLGIRDLVHFRPFRDEVLTVYAAADIFVLPSLAETYGMVTIEAMAAGLPVIGTNSAGTPEILRDGWTGLLVPPRDPGAIAHAIARLEDDPAEAVAMGLRARTDAHERFSHTVQCDMLEQLIEPSESV